MFGSGPGSVAPWHCCYLKSIVQSDHVLTAASPKCCADGGRGDQYDREAVGDYGYHVKDESEDEAVVRTGKRTSAAGVHDVNEYDIVIKRKMSMITITTGNYHV